MCRKVSIKFQGRIRGKIKSERTQGRGKCVSAPDAIETQIAIAVRGRISFLIVLVLSQFLGLFGAGTGRLVTTAIIADNRRERENTNKEKCDNPLHQDGHIKGSDIRPSKFMELRAMFHVEIIGVR